VLFVLYTNAAVVAVKFHDVPPKLAMLTPAPLLLPLAVHLLMRREKILLTPALPWIVLFIGVQMISALACPQPELALDSLKTTVLEGLLLYLVVTNVIRSERTLKWAVGALLAAGFFLGALSVMQQATGTFQKNYGGFAQVAEGEGFGVPSGYGVTRQRRLCGPVGEQNRYAQIMLMLLPLGYFSIRAEASWRRKLLWGAGTALAAMGCILTFSRGAVVGFGIVIVVMMVMGYVKPSQLFGLGVAVLLLLAAAPQFQKRLASIPTALGVFTGEARDADAVDGAIRGRATAMLAAARVWADHPVLGVGPGMFNYYSRNYGKEGGLRALEGTREAHSLYLEIAAESGTLGLAAFGAVMAVSLSLLARLRRQFLRSRPFLANMAAGLFLALTAYLATGLFLHLSYARYFWLMLAVADSLAFVAARSAVSASE
jgi:O-antigen ligase